MSVLRGGALRRINQVYARRSDCKQCQFGFKSGIDDVAYRAVVVCRDPIKKHNLAELLETCCNIAALRTFLEEQVKVRHCVQG